MRGTTIDQTRITLCWSVVGLLMRYLRMRGLWQVLCGFARTVVRFWTPFIPTFLNNQRLSPYLNLAWLG